MAAIQVFVTTDLTDPACGAKNYSWLVCTGSRPAARQQGVSVRTRYRAPLVECTYDGAETIILKRRSAGRNTRPISRYLPGRWCGGGIVC